MPDCVNSVTGEIQASDFLIFELVQDNEGLDKSSQQFKDKYANNNDSKLGSSAPSSVYIATTLGQQTIVFPKEEAFRIQVNGTEHGGRWIFKVRPCVNRTLEDYGDYDCAGSTDTIALTIEDQCQLVGNESLAQCNDDIDDDDEDSDQDDEDDDTGDEDDTTDEELDEPDEPVYYNTAPILLNFDQNFVTEILQGEVVLMNYNSQIFDPDFDDVITAKSVIPLKMTQWVTFDSESVTFELRPTKSTPVGLQHGLKLELDDGYLSNEYFIPILVIEEEDLAI